MAVFCDVCDMLGMYGSGRLESGVVVVTIKEIIVAWKTAEPVLKKVWRIIRRRQDEKRSNNNDDLLVGPECRVPDDYTDH